MPKAAIKNVGKKVTTGVSLTPDVRAMLERQAERKGLNMSTYIERLILEQEWLHEHKTPMPDRP